MRSGYPASLGGCLDQPWILVQGIYVYDREGNKYLDALAGLWCTALGKPLSYSSLVQTSYLFLHLVNHCSLYLLKELRCHPRFLAFPQLRGGNSVELCAIL